MKNFVLFKKYRSIPLYLKRFTILKLFNFHLRIHKILSEDKTEFYHNHPFSYLSIILNGGYIEQNFKNDNIIEIIHKRFSFIFKNKDSYHRIKNVKPNTITLFFAIGNTKKWYLKSINKISRPIDGIYERNINNKIVYSKCNNGMFYIGSENINICKNENRLSIYQEDLNYKLIYNENIEENTKMYTKTITHI